MEVLKLATDNLKESLDDDGESYPKYQTTLLQSLHHVATEIRSNLQQTAGHNGYDNITTESAQQCVPDSLYMLLKWIIGGDSKHDDLPLMETEGSLHKEILSIGQTILYALSKGKKNTPKHIGTGLLVHHATQSKQLINYLHAAGDSISYATVQRIDISIAQDQLSRFVDNNNLFTPESIVPGRFFQFAADNLDILEETLDGRGTSQVTQMGIFQRGPENPYITQDTTIGRNRSLKNVHVAPEFNATVHVDTTGNHVPPVFDQPAGADPGFFPRGGQLA